MQIFKQYNQKGAVSSPARSLEMLTKISMLKMKPKEKNTVKAQTRNKLFSI